MPALSSSALLSWSELEARDRCPKCSARVPAWRWVRLEGLRVLTHDGDLICPKDATLGYELLPAPLSRTEHAELVPSSCMGCRQHVNGWRWVQVDGDGVLSHDTPDGPRACPSGARFDWATGATLPAAASVVAA
ncbi:hypothetical protein BJP40_08205 [Streptomyces sp. CC53]|uniref:hypothetical protein n=1 Tax=Streptomyces sp. CC53 TaxID=1906740 RepID=UPI0008DDC609|nr:hypothetical protein [Streptomyces sp. CC53]OII60837.1 hypothetical protein BJP40_08205 [Streptomyces sp. CC53]